MEGGHPPEVTQVAAGAIPGAERIAGGNPLQGGIETWDIINQTEFRALRW